MTSFAAPARTLALLLPLALPLPALSDGYIMGAGRWSCADALRADDSGTDIELGQLVGWITGFWTAATFTRETGFIDIVQEVGPKNIFGATLGECRNAPADTPLYQVVQAMIENTK